LAYMLIAEISPLRFVVYAVAQLLGAMVGAGFIKTVNSYDFDHAEAARNLNQHGTLDSNNFGIEILTCGILVMVWLSITERRRRNEDRWFGHIVLGFVFLVVYLIELPINGGGMNPARAFASAALSGIWTAQWPFWVGPLVGTVIAVIIYELFIREKGYGHNDAVDPLYHPVTAKHGGHYIATQTTATHRRKPTTEATPLTS